MFSTAFIAIGHTATSVKSDIKPYLDSTMEHIKWVLLMATLLAYSINFGTGWASRYKSRHNPVDLSLYLIVVCRKKNVEAEGPIFQCIAMLAAAVGPALTKWLHDVLELMFNCGLSQPLQEALVAIATNIPPFLKPIQSPFLARRWT